MDFKRNIYRGMSLLVAGVALTACSNVDEDDRFIYVEPEPVAKRVLIEDFTGQRCVNCPAATAIIEQLQESYGADNVIAVAIHSGPFGKGTPLRTDTGDYYYSKWGVKQQPTGMIDRQGLESNSLRWTTIVSDQIGKTAPLELEGEGSYDETSREASITVSAEGVLDVSGTLQVWLVEDGIVGIQLKPNNVTDREYVHNHVFRATVNDRDGEAFSVASGEKKDLTFTYKLDAGWNAANMAAVAFVADATGVLQTVRIPLVKAGSGGGE